jgi:hypothetical protein
MTAKKTREPDLIWVRSRTAVDGEVHRVGLTTTGQIAFFSHDHEDVANTKAALSLGGKPDCVCFELWKEMNGESGAFGVVDDAGVPPPFLRSKNWRLWRRWRRNQPAQSQRLPRDVQLVGTPGAIRKYGMVDILRAAAQELAARGNPRAYVEDKRYLKLRGSTVSLHSGRNGLASTNGKLFAHFKAFDKREDVQRVVWLAANLLEMARLGRRRDALCTKINDRVIRVFKAREDDLEQALIGLLAVHRIKRTLYTSHNTSVDDHTTDKHKKNPLDARYSVNLRFEKLSRAMVRRLLDLLGQHYLSWRHLMVAGHHEKKD